MKIRAALGLCLTCILLCLGCSSTRPFLKPEELSKTAIINLIIAEQPRFTIHPGSREDFFSDPNSMIEVRNLSQSCVMENFNATLNNQLLAKARTAIPQWPKTVMIKASDYTPNVIVLPQDAVHNNGACFFIESYASLVHINTACGSRKDAKSPATYCLEVHYQFRLRTQSGKEIASQKIFYSSQDYNRLTTNDEYTKDRCRFIKDEMEFAADKISDEMINYFKGPDNNPR